MMESIEKLRELAADINGTEIIAHIDVGSRFVIHTEWIDSWHKAFDAACDEIEREIAERYMELPDAGDGKPIHVGDHIVRDGEQFTVCAIAPGRVHYWVWDKNGKCSTVDCDPMYCSHYKPRTLEDVLTDFAEAIEERGTEWVDVSQTANAIRELIGGDA